MNAMVDHCTFFVVPFVSLKTINVNPLHNAHVCYFNNVWFMFLVFKIFSNNHCSPPPPLPRSFAFPTPVLYLVNPPPPRIAHSGSLTH